jgi:hypothetical protein
MLSVADPETGLTDFEVAMQPWAVAGERILGPGGGDDLLAHARAIGLMFSQVEAFAADLYDGTPGWSVMLDVDRCPTEGLPYLAQWVGERLPIGITDDPNPANPVVTREGCIGLGQGRSDARQWIIDTPNQYRGTPESVARAAQRWLTGSKLVMIAEQWNALTGLADEDYLSVQVYTDQLPANMPSAAGLALVGSELRKVVPADVTLVLQNVAGITWEALKLGGFGALPANPTWAQVKATFATWADVAGVEAGFETWTR